MGQVVQGMMRIDMWAIPHIDIERFALADGESQEIGQFLGRFLGRGNDGPATRQPFFPLLGRTMGMGHLAVFNVLFKHSPVEDIFITKQVLVVAQVMAIAHIE